MKTLASLLLLVLIFATSCISKQGPYEKFFEEGTLRIDYFHSGNADHESVNIDQTYMYELWAGSKTHLLDQLDYGSYYYKIYDKASEVLIYSKGFDSYFKEYQLTSPAINGEEKTYHESAIIPFPSAEIIFALEKRNNNGELSEVFRMEIDPESAKPAETDPEVDVYLSLENGDPGIKADILIIGEGYTTEETEKFKTDLEHFTEVFFRAEPCKSYRDKFNIRGVLKASIDSGVDEPRAGIDRNTALSASFNALGSSRYLLTEDNKALRDIAGHAPYDALYIMVNSERYGGGGIYNFYCVFTSDNIDSDYLMVHEFGHSFFGLADEYYTSSTAYNDFYPPGYEPNEANITALKDPENIKWKHLLSPGIEIPTPWAKNLYDSLDHAWQTERALMTSNINALKKSGAPDHELAAAMDTYDRRSKERDQEIHIFLEENELTGKVGAFEGAGYASTGLYRPSLNCIMFSRARYFCPVCQDAMKKVIVNYSE